MASLLLIILEAFCVRPPLLFSCYRHVVIFVPTRRSSLHLSSISLRDVVGRHRVIIMHFGDALTHIAIILEALQVL